MHLQNALPGAADPQFQQASTAYDRQSNHLNYGVSAIYQPPATFEATPSAYHDLELRKAPRLSSYSPRKGTKGTLVYVSLEASSDLLSPNPPTASMMFAKRSVPAALHCQELGEQNGCYKYLVYASAPPFSETESSTLRIPLRLQIQDQSRLDADSVYFGDWLYEDGKRLEHRSSPQEASRKRKITDEPSDTPRSAKRLMPSEQETTQSQEYGSYTYPSASLAYQQSLLPSLDISTMQRKYTAYGRSQLQQSLHDKANTMGSQGLIGGVPTAQSSMRPPTGQTSPWGSSHGAGYQSGRTPQPNTSPSFQISSVSSSSPANPTLIRTLLLQQRSIGTRSAGSSSGGNLDPYALYINGAVLEIRGNLNAMLDNWTNEERAAKRRIVGFRREQNGTTINAYFRPVRADEQPLPHESNINCIYWEESEKYYVTSVDTISLLESLVGSQFDSGEKGRIRRNLETYKPCTVSKGKPDSERFFKLIMGFHHPKPRSIEKDVKAFEWRILEQALKKIVSKYVCSILCVGDLQITDLHQCADPSSTAGLLDREPSSNLSGSQSEAGTSRYSAVSSRSASGSAASSAYAQTFKSSTLSPPAPLHGLPSYQQTPPLQQLSAPSLTHSYTVPALGSPYVPNDTFDSPYAPQGSIPSLSSPYTASTIGRRRSSEALTDDISASPSSHYYSPRYPPTTSTFFATQYAQQEWAEATATLGLPGRASADLSAHLNTDGASSDGGIGDAQYRQHHHSGVNVGEAEAMRFKEE